MRLYLVPLVAILPLLFSAVTFGQAGSAALQGGAPSPGAPAPGAQAPGLPPRDINRATPTTGTARIRGRILADQAGQPLRRAQVTVTMEGSQLRRATTTDAEGFYQFEELPAGRYTLTAMKAGYVTLQYGQRRPFEAGTPVTLADGEVADRANFVLPRGAVIAVRVTDEFGEPVAGVSIQVQRFTYGQDGQRRLTSAGGAATSLAAGTDDRGEFRAYGLMPGEYVVQGTMRLGGAAVGTGGDSSEGFAPTFYPGTISAAEAQPISLGIAQELSIQLPMVAARFLTVRGTVFDSEGKPAAGAQLSLVTATENSMSSRSAGQVAPDGTFVISGVPPGEQNVRVTLSRAGSAGESASVPIVVGGTDISGLQITTATGARVTGRVVFDGTSPKPTTPMRVTATQSDPMRRMASVGGPTDPLANGTIDGDGNFAIAGVMGTVFFGMPVQPGWMLRSVTLDGRDITDVPLDMTGRTSVSGLELALTDKLTNISGQVTDARAQPVRDYVVVLQAAEDKEPIVASRWIRVVRPDTSGRFQVRGMREGRYVATALEALEQGREFSPAFQRELRRFGREFTAGEGESVTLDLRLTPDL